MGEDTLHRWLAYSSEGCSWQIGLLGSGGEWPAFVGQSGACALSLCLLLVPPPLELHGAEVAEVRAAASTVVEDLDELEDRRPQSIPRRPVVTIEQFGLQRGEEALGDGVVGRRTRATHTADDAGSPQVTAEAKTSVRTSLVRVMNEPRIGAAHALRHLEGAQVQFGVEHVVHRPTNRLPLEDVEDDAQVQPAFAGTVLGDVGHHTRLGASRVNAPLT